MAATTAPGTTTSARTTTAGIAGVLAATVCWSIGPTLAKSVDTSGLAVALWRMWFGSVFLLSVLVLRNGLPSLAVLRKCVLGGVLFGINVAFFYEALNSTSVAIAEILGALTPVVLIPVAIRYLGDRISTLGCVCAAAALGGTVLTIAAASDFEGHHVKGDLLALAALITWSAYFLVTKRVRSEVGALDYLTCMTFVAALTLTPIALVMGAPLGSVEGGGWLWIVLLCLVPGALGHGLMIWAHAHVAISVSSVLALQEPVLASIVAVIVLDESLTALQAIGMAVVVASLATLAVRARRADAAHHRTLTSE